MNKKKFKIAVLLGGLSSEREISLRTGRNVTMGLRAAGYDAAPVEVRKGKDFLSPLKKLKPDLCFIALHGRFGEDGTIQGCLELLGLPYTGSGVLSSALCMDKVASKKMFKKDGILTPPYRVFMKHQHSVEKIQRDVDSVLSYPVVVKPAREGSTIGVSIVKHKKALQKALQKGFACDEKILVEKFIRGIEVTCPVLGNSKPCPLPPIEIVSNTAGGFYDFKAKYTRGGSTHIIPPELPRKVVDKICDSALLAHISLQCDVLSRVDMMVDGGVPYVLEVNTIPGMTETSLFPESARAAGMTFEALLEKIIRYSLEKKN